MIAISAEIREQTRLRREAETLLAGGQAPPSRGWELGTDALALLYRLASDLNSSDDALAVLHELQVHQVELDLQLEQLEANETELNEELQRYRELYEHAPAGYLLLGPEGRIIEANQTAKRLLASLDGDSVSGPHIVDLISPEDRPALHAMLEQLGSAQPIASCDVHAIGAAPDAPKLRLSARVETGSDNVWMVVS